MAWSGGTYTRSNGTYTGSTVWATDEANSVNIESARHDTHDQDLATGINTCLTKDGQNSPSAHLNWVNTEYYASSTGGSANAITIALTNAPGAYYAGMVVRFTASSTNTDSCTGNVNSLGAKTFKDTYGNTLLAGNITSGNTYVAIYDGTDLILTNPTIIPVTFTSTCDGFGAMDFNSQTQAFGDYTKVGDMVDFRLKVTGTTATSGTVAITYTLPVQPDTTGETFACTVYDGGGTAEAGFSIVINTTSTGTAYAYKYDQTAFGLGASAGFVVQGRYKAA